MWFHVISIVQKHWVLKKGIFFKTLETLSKIIHTPYQDLLSGLGLSLLYVLSTKTHAMRSKRAAGCVAGWMPKPKAWGFLQQAPVGGRRDGDQNDISMSQRFFPDLFWSEAYMFIIVYRWYRLYLQCKSPTTCRTGMLIIILLCVRCHEKVFSYCWWKKSCTSCYGKNPIIYRVLYIPGGAGFLPSTVPHAKMITDSLVFCLQAHKQKLIREEDVDSGNYQGGIL